MPNNVKNTSSTKYCLKDYKIIVKIHDFLIFLEKKLKDEINILITTFMKNHNVKNMSSTKYCLKD